jgi:hypothetical protein
MPDLDRDPLLGTTVEQRLLRHYALCNLMTVTNTFILVEMRDGFTSAMHST